MAMACAYLEGRDLQAVTDASQLPSCSSQPRDLMYTSMEAGQRSTHAQGPFSLQQTSMQLPAARDRWPQPMQLARHQMHRTLH